MRWVNRIAPALAAAALLCSGCNLFGLGLYAIMAEKTRVVKAIYDLKPAAEKGRVMVIRVWADPAIAGEHPYATLRTAKGLRAAFLKPESPLAKLRIKRPESVEFFQQSQGGSDSLTPDEFAEHFKADIVLDVVLEEYTNLAPGSQDLFQGRITAHLGLYEFSKGEDNQLPVDKRRLEVVFPDKPIDLRGGETTQETIRAELHRRFSDKVFRKFHDHEVPLSDPKGEYADE